MIYLFRQVDRESEKTIGIIGYDFPNPSDDHPTIHIAPIQSQEEYDAIVAELTESEEEDESN